MNEIDEIADDFIRQLNGDEEMPRELPLQRVTRRVTLQNDMRRRTTKKLPKIMEMKETPMSGNGEDSGVASGFTAGTRMALQNKEISISEEKDYRSRR